MKTWEIRLTDREYALSLGDPCLGTVNANTKEEAEAEALKLGLMKNYMDHPWATEIKVYSTPPNQADLHDPWK